MGLSAFFRNLRLGVKLNIVVIFALVALLAAVTTVTLISAQSLITRAGRQRVEQEVKVVQSRFGEAEQEVLASARMLASTPGLAEAVASRDATGIRTIALFGAASLDLDDVDMVGSDGAYITTVLGETLHTTPYDTLVLSPLMGVETISVIMAEEEAGLGLAAAVPLRDASGAVVGALIASRRVDDGFLEEVNFTRADVHLALIAGGQILAQDFPTPERLGELSAALLEESAIEHTLSGHTLVADDLLFTTGGAPYALAHVPLTVRGHTYAAIGILVDLGELSVFQRGLAVNTAAIFACLTLVTVLVVALFARRSFVVPIRNLTSAAERIASGDYQQAAEVTTTDEVGQLASAFNTMATRLRQTLESLERRTADLQRRSVQLGASAEVGGAAASILEVDQLVRQVVDLVCERFDLYYVGLFLLDGKRRFAVLHAGTGEAGEKMLAQGHRLEVGSDSMIGQCTVKAEAAIALDVGEGAVRFDNPLLPETRSEMALPLRSRGQVIGAMTVQSVEAAAFDEADVAVMQTMADQVAVAIDNARLFSESQAALGAERRAYGELSRQAWSELLRGRTDWGYRYADQSVAPATGEWRPEMREALQMGEAARRDGGDGEERFSLAVPIKVRGEVIGVLDTYKPADTGEWTGEEIALLETLADQLGQALEGARLYRDTQRRAAREQASGYIVDRMRRAVDIETLMQTTIQEMASALGASSAFVQLDIGTEMAGDEGEDGRRNGEP